MARSTARKRALNTLYEADEKDQDILSLLDERIAHPGAQTPLPDYAIQIVRGVAEHQATIDETIDRHSTRWPLSRMHVIDRNLLRIATWEMLYNPDVPDKVAIDEALSLAKTLSDADAPAFIHGLLSAVRKEKEQEAQHDDMEAVRRQEASRIADLALAEASRAEQDLSQDQEEDGRTEIQNDDKNDSSPAPGFSDHDGGPDDTHEDGISLADLNLSLPEELSDEGTSAK